MAEGQGTFEGDPRSADPHSVNVYNNAQAVRREYADESRLVVRASVWQHATGPNAVLLAREAVAQVAPARVLDVGSGRGETAEWIVRATDAEVIAIDQSARMVELTRARGIEAVVADVQQLPFEDESFDCAVAAWMLYHVTDIDQGLSEIVRILRPGGRLVAVTNSRRHTQELRRLVNATLAIPFDAENGEEILLRHFAAVERRDAEGFVVLEPHEAVAYMQASVGAWGGDRVPKLIEPIKVTKATAVFVATK
jgi:ubiquinone/menaquinone biosynthesis C-methylase UbiE